MSPVKTILIIEDEIPLLDVLREKFIQEGFTVLGANNGREGLELALSKHPDLILLDMVLPGIDGLTVLEKIHADTWGKSAKVIMLTNLSDSQSVAAAMKLGSHDFLVKSDWKIEDVVKTVRAKLKV